LILIADIFIIHWWASVFCTLTSVLCLLFSDLCLPRRSLFGEDGSSDICLQTIFAHPVYTNFHVFDHTREGALHGLQVYIQALRV